MIRKMYLGALVAISTTACGAYPGQGGDDADPELGTAQEDIIGGTFAWTADEFPGIAALIGYYSTPDYHFCAGTLVGPRWVVTAGHCFDPKSDGSTSNGSRCKQAVDAREPDPACEVDLGEEDWLDSYDQTRGATLGKTFFHIASIHVHPSYNPTTLVNDIALVELSADVPASTAVPSPVLATRWVNQVPFGASLTAVGWGADAVSGDIITSVPARPSTILKIADGLSYFGDKTTCEAQTSWPTTMPIVPDRPSTSHLCAGSTVPGDHDPTSAQTYRGSALPEVEEGVCYGDSGGPLYDELPITGLSLMGITSASVGCALKGYPALFSRAGDYVDALRGRGANPFGLSAPIPGLHTPAPIGPFAVKGMGADMQFASAGLTSTTMAGDFNHDGYADIAYWGTCGADLHDCWRVHINAKNGSFVSPPSDYGASIRFHDGTPKSTPMVGDFNHDGYADIAYYGICGNPGTACWRIHINNKSGAFNNPKDYGGEIQFKSSGITSTPMVGDFNHDGYADIAYWGTCGTDSHGCWRVHVNAKNGTFVSPPSDYGASTRFLGDVVAGTPMAGDFNGDGYTDITYWGKCGDDARDCWRVHVNGKNAKFSSAPDYGASMWFQTSDPTSTPRSGDFNGDGYSDIAYYGKCGSPPSACWRVHLSNHAGAFEVHGYGADMWFAGTDPIHAPMAGDFDGDGVDGIAYKGRCGSGGSACWRTHQR